MKETVDLKSVWNTLRKRWLVILVPTVLAAATAWIVTLPRFMRPVYQSSATLMVEFPQVLAPGLSSLVANPSMPEQMARLQTQIQSTDFLRDVVTRSGLREDAAIRRWAARSQRRYPELSMDELVDLRLMDYLRGAIRMSSDAARSDALGNVIRITVQDYSPDGARKLVQTVTQAIMEANVAEQVAQVKNAGDFSASQLQEYQAKLREAEDNLDAYRRRVAARSAQPTLVTDQTYARVQEMRDNAALDLDRQERDLTAAEQALRAAGSSPAAVTAVLGERTLAGALNDARTLESSYVRQSVLDASSGGGGSQGTAISLARKVDEILRSARNRAAATGPSSASDAAGDYLEAQIRRDLARTRLGAYDNHLGDYRARLTSAPDADLELQRLQHQVDSYRQYQSAFAMQMASSQISEAYSASSLGKNKISILERPQLPLKPVRPQRGQIVILAVVAGLALGIGGVFVLEHHDPTFRDVRDIERSLGLRVVATVPRMEIFQRMTKPGRKRVEAPLRAAEAERAVESFLDESPGLHEFRKLVLAIFRAGNPHPRTVMITSSRRGEGKSTSATCLALTLAREFPEERVILVDFDTRRAALGPFFGVNGSGPQGSCLLGPRTWEGEPLVSLPVPNLKLLVPSDRGHAHSERVTVESVRWLLTMLRPRADRIIIDSPPNLPVPDALVIGPEVDLVLMVVKAGETPREMARRGVELQRHFRDNLAGILMNNSGEVLPYYYDYRHYGYGYSEKRPDKRG